MHHIVLILPSPILSVSLSLPPRGLSANARSASSRMAKSRPVKAYRTEAGWAWKEAVAKRPLWVALERAVVRATFYWPDKRRRDRDNAAASLKAAWDAMQDAGVIENDSGLVHLPPTFEIDRKRPRVVLECFNVHLDIAVGGST